MSEKKTGLSTKGIKISGLSKTIEPGVHVLKINGVRLVRFPFMESDEGYFLVLDVETRPIPNFEGFFINKDDESLGRYEGQIGQVKTNRYYYKDGVTKTDVTISRDTEILKQIKNICVVTDTVSWFEKADDKYETIEDFVEGFNKSGIFKNKYLNFCIGGKEYERDGGFTSYDLFIPKLAKGRVAFEPENVKVSKLMAFNQTEHVIRQEHKPVDSFEDIPITGDGELAVEASDDDLSASGMATPPEFEL